ncbi:hypothetical protein ICR95_07705 [Priestia megaterium]|uniref:hypothetical protein n=1 Tax=Priestia megaterium TaxID=1404 RepID=UPI00196B6CED|nr:hypothetical protein [Priestia megaterium]QSF34701.1 hypothetical protein ICR95_07705 [Priestia megaterium]
MMRKWIWSKIKYEVNEIIKEKSLKSEEDYKNFIKQLKKYYQNFESTCEESENTDFTKELLLRRRELKSEASYLINVGSGVVAGLVTGAGVSLFPYGRLSVHSETSNFNWSDFFWWFALALMLLVIILAVVGIYKIFNYSINPYQTYAQEKELEIIEEIIKRKLD